MKKFTTILATGLLMTALVAGTVLADTNKDASEVTEVDVVEETQDYNVVTKPAVVTALPLEGGYVYQGNQVYVNFKVQQYVNNDDSVLHVKFCNSNGTVIKEFTDSEIVDEERAGYENERNFSIIDKELQIGTYTVKYYTQYQAEKSFEFKVVSTDKYAVGPYATWKVDQKNHKLIISGKGRIDDYCEAPFWDEITSNGEGSPLEKYDIVIEPGITYIGYCALNYVPFIEFDKNGEVVGGTTITIPTTVKTVDDPFHYPSGGSNPPYMVIYEGTKEQFGTIKYTGIFADDVFGAFNRWGYTKFSFHTHSYTNGVCACGNVANGLAKVSGVWGYYVNGKLQTTKTGIVQKAASTDKSWYFVKNGVFTKNSGIALKADGSSKTWYYVKDGVYTKATGIAQKADKSSTAWYYVANGVYTTAASGIAQKADRSSTSWFYVKNGVYTKATGIAQKADKSSATWYYVANGTYSKATGISKKADGSSTTWYYVKSGVYTKATCIAPIAGQTAAKYYVKSGVWTKTTGKVTIGTKTYTLKAGVVV